MPTRRKLGSSFGRLAARVFGEFAGSLLVSGSLPVATLPMAQPYFIFSEDFEIWLGLLGYSSIIRASPDDPTIDAKSDETLLRYITAAITNPTISAYVAQNYVGKGRAAWKYLNDRPRIVIFYRHEYRW